MKRHRSDPLSDRQVKSELRKNSILQTGSSVLRKWRLDEHNSGRIVRMHDIPELVPVFLQLDYHRYTRTASTITALPIDLIRECIFKYLDAHSLFAMMLTCSYFQSTAYLILTVRAQHIFGAHGTPSAILAINSNCLYVESLGLPLVHKKRPAVELVSMAIARYGYLRTPVQMREYRCKMRIAQQRETDFVTGHIESLLYKVNKQLPDALQLTLPNLHFLDETSRLIAELMLGPTTLFRHMQMIREYVCMQHSHPIGRVLEPFLHDSFLTWFRIARAELDQHEERALVGMPELFMFIHAAVVTRNLFSFQIDNDDALRIWKHVFSKAFWTLSQTTMHAGMVCIWTRPNWIPCIVQVSTEPFRNNSHIYESLTQFLGHRRFSVSAALKFHHAWILY